MQNCNHGTGSEEAVWKISTVLFLKVDVCDFLRGCVLLNIGVGSTTAQAAVLSIAVRYMQERLFGSKFTDFEPLVLLIRVVLR